MTHDDNDSCRSAFESLEWLVANEAYREHFQASDQAQRFAFLNERMRCRNSFYEVHYTRSNNTQKETLFSYM